MPVRVDGTVNGSEKHPCVCPPLRRVNATVILTNNIMPYNPDIHHRRSIRLPEYDYAAPGFYFVTLCVHGRLPLLGAIADGTVHLNAAGRMVEEWYHRCAEHFPDIECLEMVVMPNHFHCIWHNTGIDADANHTLSGEHTGSPLQRVVQWFKTMTTNAYIRGVEQHGWPTFDTRLWQRNYYEHIIRDQQSYEEIVTYILENPLRWHDDKLYVP